MFQGQCFLTDPFILLRACGLAADSTNSLKRWRRRVWVRTV